MALNITGETLDALPPPTASVDIGSQTLVNVADPTGAQDAATDAWVSANFGMIVKANGPNSGIGVNSASYQTICAADVASIAAGDSIITEVWGTLLNNSGTTRTLSYALTVGTVTIMDVSDTGTVANHATSLTPFEFRMVVSVSATNLWRFLSISYRYATTAAGALTSGTNTLIIWNTGTDDLSGTKTVTFKMHSNSTTATQTFNLHAWRIARLHSNL